MSLPTNFYMVHDGRFRQTNEVFEDLGDAVAFADEMAVYEGVTWYVAACLLPNAVAYTTKPPKRRTNKATAKR